MLALSLRDKLETLIKKKEIEIGEYEGKIKEAKSYIQALQDSIRLLPKYDNEGNGTREVRIKPGSNPDKVHELLKTKGHPLHIKEIVEGIGLEYNRISRSTIRSALSPYVKNGQLFKLVSPGTIGLIEWEGKQQQFELDESEPEDIK